MSTFALPHGLDSPRFARVEEVVPGWFVHTLVVTMPDELDTEVQSMGTVRATGSWGCGSASGSGRSPRGGNHGGKDSRSQAELRSKVIERTRQRESSPFHLTWTLPPQGSARTLTSFSSSVTMNDVIIPRSETNRPSAGSRSVCEQRPWQRDSAESADRAASPVPGALRRDGSDADARERVGALFGLSAAAAEERDRRKAAEAEPARLKGDE